MTEYSTINTLLEINKFVATNTNQTEEEKEKRVNAMVAAMEATDKQEQQKVVTVSHIFNGITYEECYCPRCYRIFEGFLPNFGVKPYYCDKCGQALDWSEVED